MLFQVTNRAILLAMVTLVALAGIIALGTTLSAMWLFELVTERKAGSKDRQAAR